MEPRLKWNRIILAAKTILFHFRRGSMLKQELFRRWDSERELFYDNIVHVEASACAHWTTS